MPNQQLAGPVSCVLMRVLTTNTGFFWSWRTLKNLKILRQVLKCQHVFHVWIFPAQCASYLRQSERSFCDVNPVQLGLYYLSNVLVPTRIQTQKGSQIPQPEKNKRFKSILHDWPRSKETKGSEGRVQCEDQDGNCRPQFCSSNSALICEGGKKRTFSILQQIYVVLYLKVMDGFMHLTLG